MKKDQILSLIFWVHSIMENPHPKWNIRSIEDGHKRAVADCVSSVNKKFG
jgi:hypothetical protein